MNRLRDTLLGRQRLAPLCLALMLLSAPRAALAQAPPEFTNSLVASVQSPTALAFAPDGRLLIASQLGRLYVYQNGALQSTPALTLGSRVCTDSERGLLGVAIDPSFATNSFIYLFYTFNKSPCVNRVSRFVLSSSNQVDLASETVLIDNMPSEAGNHNAGDVHFGKDGLLYVSIGDSGCDYAGDSGCAGANNASRDSHILLGKILRISPDGGIPATNPYRGTDSARCNVTGRTDPGKKCQETYASGLRNPFRMAFDPNAAGTRFFINDVGQGQWEEINLGQAAADYGWNIREGFCANGSTTNCSNTPAGLTDPIHAYGRSTGCAAVTGGAFVPNGVWPAVYDNTYLFADYTCGTIFVLTQSGSSYTRTTFVSGLGSSSATAMRFGPFNGTQALYYLTYAGGGQVRRISYAGVTNRPPVAAVTANPTSGALPLAVFFDGRGSSDPDGSALTYDWNFGDGTAHGTTATVNHTYTTAGPFVATLTVRDPQLATGTASVTIQAGNRPPDVAITSPTTTTQFRVGQTITLQGTATDPDQGPLPASAMTWSITLHHGSHTHPFMPPTTGNGLTFQAPQPEDLAAAAVNYLEIVLTAVDSGGLTTTVRQDLMPRTVNVSFATEPAGLRVVVNGTNVTGPQTIVSWDNYSLNVDAPAQLDGAGQVWIFQSWSNGQPARHTLVTPATAAQYTARFVPGTPGAVGLVAAYAFNEPSGTTVTDSSGNSHTGSLVGATRNAAGRYGNAIAFDGVNDTISVADSSMLDLTSAMTLEAWVFPTALGGSRTIVMKESSSSLAYSLHADNGGSRPVAQVNTGAGAIALSGTAPLALNVWTHVACTYNGSTLRLYINGVEVGSRQVSGSLTATTQPLRIGGNTPMGQYFQGTIDDVRVYNRALSQAEIQFDLTRSADGAVAPLPPTNVRIVR